MHKSWNRFHYTSHHSVYFVYSISLYHNAHEVQFQGVLLGLSNTAGVLAGVFGTAATGYILQKGPRVLHIHFEVYFFATHLSVFTYM